MLINQPSKIADWASYQVLSDSVPIMKTALMRVVPQDWMQVYLKGASGSFRPQKCHVIQSRREHLETVSNKYQHVTAILPGLFC